MKFFPSLILLIFVMPASIQARPVEAQHAPELYSPSAILIDADSGRILFEKNADEALPPASLTKVVTMHLALEAVSRGRLGLDDEVDLPSETWAVNMPPRSSLMFLGPGQRVSVRELLEGMAVASGNDAASALALHLAGSIPAFAARMNEAVRALGYSKMHFEEPSGISENNLITAREFCFFLKDYLRAHPNSLEELHSLKDFSYPKPANLKNGQKLQPIIQHNKNALLNLYPGVDGIKTGFIVESGFNLALTAKNNGMRLISVTLGARNESRTGGAGRRNRDGIALLEFGFGNFTTVEAPMPKARPIKVWKGEPDSFTPEMPERVAVTIAKSAAAELKGELTQISSLTAPVAAGSLVGRVVFTAGGEVARTIELDVGKAIPPGPWWRQVLDSILLFFLQLFGAAH